MKVNEKQLTALCTNNGILLNLEHEIKLISDMLKKNDKHMKYYRTLIESLCKYATQGFENDRVDLSIDNVYHLSADYNDEGKTIIAVKYNADSGKSFFELKDGSTICVADKCLDDETLFSIILIINFKQKLLHQEILNDIADSNQEAE